MPLVKIQRKFQITIPVSLRKQIALGEGDMLEAIASKGGILLKPQTVVDRKKVVGNLRKIFADMGEKSPCQGMSDEEIMEEAIKTIAEVRAERKTKSKKS